MSVCGTVSMQISLEVFLGSALPEISFDESPVLHNALANPADLPTEHNRAMDPNPIRGLKYSTPSLHHSAQKLGNINPTSIASGIRHRLRTD